MSLDSTMNGAMYAIDSEEGPTSAQSISRRQYGHRPPVRAAIPGAAVDSLSDLRAEMLSVMFDMGVQVEKQPPRGGAVAERARLSLLHARQDRRQMQISKYVVHSVAHQYGKTATVHAKADQGDNGSGMHTHQSIWKGERPAFGRQPYADLSETALYYIGGNPASCQGAQCLHQPTTNSYKRLIPGFGGAGACSPTRRATARAAAHPDRLQPKAKRVRCATRIRRATPISLCGDDDGGLDGVQNLIHPGDAMDRTYDLPPEELRRSRRCAARCGEAIGELQQDHAS